MIGIIGLGYVGLITGLGMCSKGQQIIGCDIDEKKVSLLKKGVPTIHETGLNVCLESAIEKEQIKFTTEISDVITCADLIFVTVGTPPTATGTADLQYVYQAIREIGKRLNNRKTVVIKSTVPVGTCFNARRIIKHELAERNVSVECEVISNPEFLREGTALYDFMFPQRIVIGVDSDSARKWMVQFYIEIYGKEIVEKLICTNSKTAELAKYACNSFLATKISFINEIANYCDVIGANIMDIKTIMGCDQRIGAAHLQAGPGFGGSCLPKDLEALIKMGDKTNISLSICKSVFNVNLEQWKKVIQKIEHVIKQLNLSAPVVSILGLTFKANTADVRESPSLKVVRYLVDHGFSVNVYDPHGAKNFAHHVNSNRIVFCATMKAALLAADIAVIMTEWDEFKSISPEYIKLHMHTPALIDMRNMLYNKDWENNGIYYLGIGQGGERLKHCNLSTIPKIGAQNQAP